jgi:predicted dehydrogenase
MKRKKKKIRYALIGLGYISQNAVLPAFKNASSNSELTALVSDDPQKLEELSQKYGIELCYSYHDYEDCLRSGEVDAVYIALPNHMHHDFTIRAAKAGIHVLCEKPMAVTVDECNEMIESASQNNIQLMVAYRLHFEKGNLEAIETIRRGDIGEPRIFNSVFTMQVKDEDNIRLSRIEEGGGTMYDIGIYCINAARYLFQEEPIEAFAYSANNGEPRFSKCDEMTSVMLRFPGERLANFVCSFGSSDVATYQVVGTRGDLVMESAYEYSETLVRHLTVDGDTKTKRYKKRDQFAPELVYFSNCILKGKNPEPSGVEGLIDVQIINAIYQSASSGKAVSLHIKKRDERPALQQELQKPAIKEPDLIHANPPSGE